MDAFVNHAGKRVMFCNVNPKDYIEAMLLRGEWYELQNLEFIHSLEVSGNYVDIGAFIGTHSLFFSLFCPAAQVFSFEANPNTYWKLQRNLEANNVTNCQTFNIGVSDVAGHAILREANETNRGATHLSAGEGSIAVAPLDSFNLRNVRVMKIDVEGMELRVLHGAVETLKSVEHLFVEMWSEPQSRDRAMEYTAPKVVEFLAEQGLALQRELASDRLYYFLRGGRPAPLTVRI
jgi:FkbM family methyltransferase